MPPVGFTNLLIVTVVALLAPLLLGFAPRLRLPAVVLEIVAGVVLGPGGLGWLKVDLAVQVVAVLGLAFLLLLAGLEIDLVALRGRWLGPAVAGYALTLTLGVAVGFGARAAGWVDSALLLAIALSATSLGLVVAVLKDAGALTGDVGQAVVAAATVADFAAIVLLSLLFSADGGGTGERVALFAVFVVAVAAIAAAALTARRSMRLGDVLERLQDGTAEIRVRGAVLLMMGFVLLAQHVGLESILGAFLAGAVISAVDRDAASHPHFRVKLEALGYGFLIPVFFVASGARLDVSALLDEPSALAQVPVYLAALLVVRGVPALLYRRRMATRPVAAAGLLQATSLPFLVTAAEIGTATDRMSEVTATALVCAGLASVLIFPTTATGLLAPMKITDGAGTDRAELGVSRLSR
ncbi:cation:proton antiporter [Spongisporangium articulatum]|uniref:Cation:proton antiporter n=1 Tax=Spongisporangium articulatum TaxID=3362603 RepID=A0ABW8ALQ7_9ACTN